MAKLTSAAVNQFKTIFLELGYENAAIRLGTRPVEPDSTEHYIDFIPDDRVNIAVDDVQMFSTVMVVVRPEDKETFSKVVIDYIDEPAGFVFGGSDDG